MLLEAYLQKHFVNKNTFASLAGISVERLEQLIAADAIPAASYRCNGHSIISAVFGDTAISESLTGDFFRPEGVRWVHIAAVAPPGAERTAVLAELCRELSSALAAYDNSQQDIDSKIAAYLPYFFNGTFGLCVADPASGAGIVKKEMLQEKLIELSANGSLAAPLTVSKQKLMQLIDDYAAAAMPFSPAEYERSSRKRLVDDLRQRLA